METSANVSAVGFGGESTWVQGAGKPATSSLEFYHPGGGKKLTIEVETGDQTWEETPMRSIEVAKYKFLVGGGLDLKVERIIEKTAEAWVNRDR
jgi:hypothetical protein